MLFQKTFLKFFIFLLPLSLSAQWETVHFLAPTPGFIGEAEYISFSSPKTGVAACRQDSIVLTNDSGITWQTTFRVDSFFFNQIKHVDSNIVLTTASHESVNWTTVNKGLFLKSTDGGNTWDTTHLNFIPRSIGYATDSVFILSGLDYSYNPPKSIVLKSSNQGINWNPIGFFSTGKIANNIHFITDSIGLVAGTGGKIFKTTNQGLNWKASIVDTSKSFTINNISYPNSGTVFLMASDHLSRDYLFYSSMDSGRTWNYISSYTSFLNLLDFEFANDTVGYFSGMDEVSKTTDGGLTWVKQQSSWPSGGNFFDYVSDIQIFSEDVAYAAGPLQFYRTFKGGVGSFSVGLKNTKPYNLNKLTAYPNPTNNHVYIDIQEQKNVRFQLYNSSGQLLKVPLQQQENRYQFSMKDLPNGLYFLKVDADGDRTTLKLIKN